MQIIKKGDCMFKRILFCILIVLIATPSFSDTITRGKIGKEDVQLFDGLTGTFTRPSSTGGTSTLHNFDYDGIDVLQVYGDGSTCSDATLRNAVNQVGSSNVKLNLGRCTWTLTSNLTTNANTILKFEPGGRIDVDTFTLTHNGGIDASQEQYIFDASAGTVALSGAKVEYVTAENFGSIDGTADEVQINAALSSGVTLVKGLKRVYTTAAAIEIPDGVTYEGAGRKNYATTALGDSGTILRTAGAINVVEIIGTTGSNATNKEHSRIKYCSIDGTDNATVGIKIWDARYIIVDDVFIEDCTTSILVGRTGASDVIYDITLNNVLMNSGTTGISSSGSNTPPFINTYNTSIRGMSGDAVNGSFQGHFIGGYIGGNLGDGFDLTGSQNLSIINVLQENIGNAGTGKNIYVTGSSQNINVIGGGATTSSATYGRTHAIDFDDVTGGSIIGFQVSESSADSATFIGIEVGSDSTNISLQSNSFEGLSGSQVEYSIDGTGKNFLFEDGVANPFPIDAFVERTELTVAAAATGGADTFIVTITMSGSGSATVLFTASLAGRFGGAIAKTAAERWAGVFGVASDVAYDSDISLISSLGDASYTGQVSCAAAAAVGSDNQYTITCTNAHADTFAGEMTFDFTTYYSTVHVKSVTVANSQ